MAGNRGNVIVWPPAFVIAEEEDGILPFRTAHERIHHLRHFRLPDQDRRARSRMLAVDARASLNEAEAGKRAVAEVSVVVGQASDVIGLEAKVLRNIAHEAGRPSSACTCS